jgi:hypothetical protein
MEAADRINDKLVGAVIIYRMRFPVWVTPSNSAVTKRLMVS